jgi:hypothetical protein
MTNWGPFVKMVLDAADRFVRRLLDAALSAGPATLPTLLGRVDGPLFSSRQSVQSGLDAGVDDAGDPPSRIGAEAPPNRPELRRREGEEVVLLPIARQRGCLPTRS